MCFHTRTRIFSFFCVLGGFNRAGILHDPARGVCPLRLQPLTQQEQQRWRHSSPGLRRSDSISRMFHAALGSDKGTRQHWGLEQSGEEAHSCGWSLLFLRTRRQSAGEELEPSLLHLLPNVKGWQKEAIEWTRRYLRSTGSLSATDLLKIYFKKKKKKKANNKKERRKKTDNTGYWTERGMWILALFFSQCILNGRLIKLKFPYIGVEIFTSDNVRHVCVCACMYIRGGKNELFLHRLKLLLLIQRQHLTITLQNV